MNMITENKVVPKLRFREFDDPWIKESLRNCTIKIGSGSTPRGGDKTYTKDGEVHFIRSQNVFNNELVLTGDVFISDEINSKMKGSIVKPSDVLLNITGGSIGRSCVVPHEFSKGNVNQHVCIIRLDNQVYPYFLQPFLASQRGQKLIKRGQTGSGREGLNFQSIALFKLNLPSVEEQKKISKFLRAIDKKLQQLSKKKELLEDYKKGIIQKIFSQEIRFKDDSGNNYPDWQEKKLGEFSKFLRGHSYNSTNVKNSGLLVLRSSNIKNGRLILDKDLQFVDKKCKEEILLMNKDIVICMANGSKNLVGKSAVYLGDYQEKITIGAFCSIMRSELELSRYILQSVQFKRYLHTLLAGTNINNLKNSELSELKFWIPHSKVEQKKITDFLTSIDKKIELVSHQLEKTKEFKKGLLQQMFV